MAGINKVILIGNLGAKPELRHTAGGTAVTELRVATTEGRKDRDGNWNDVTEWHSVVVWGKQAENCERYLDKGRQVYVEGRLQTRDWVGNDGQKRYKTEVVANTVQFLSSGGGGGNYGGGAGGGGGGNYGGGNSGGGGGGGGGGGNYGGGGGAGYGGGNSGGGDSGGSGGSGGAAPGMGDGPTPDNAMDDDIPF